MKNPLNETLVLGRAHARIVQTRDGKVIAEHEAWNVITKAQIDFLFQQGYKSSGLSANGLNYIGLSNDALTEDVNSTVLSNEIASNGLTRAQGTVAHTNGTATATVVKVFTASGTQSAQKAALFSAGAAGTMGHALAFTQVNLLTNDILTITFTLTLA